MSDWERDANKALQALGDAWQQGGISRETYRARRRLLIAALRERRDDTERHPLPMPAGLPAAARAEHGATVLGSGRGSMVVWRWLVLVATVAAAAGAAWMLWFKESGNV